jgi:hypothetical protein
MHFRSDAPRGESGTQGPSVGIRPRTVPRDFGRHDRDRGVTSRIRSEPRDHPRLATSPNAITHTGALRSGKELSVPVREPNDEHLGQCPSLSARPTAMAGALKRQSYVGERSIPATNVGRNNALSSSAPERAHPPPSEGCR